MLVCNYLNELYSFFFFQSKNLLKKSKKDLENFKISGFSLFFFKKDFLLKLNKFLQEKDGLAFFKKIF